MFPIVKETKKTQYLVIVKGADQPKKRHESYGEAKKEAQRLTKVTWKPTYVLQILKKYELEVTETVYKNVV